MQDWKYCFRLVQEDISMSTVYKKDKQPVVPYL